MIDVNSIEWALYTTIASDSTIVNSNIDVDLNEPFNTDPNRSPWIGIYFANIEVEPFRVNTVNPWNVTYEFQIYVQGTSYQSGQDAHDSLDRALKVALTAVNSNRKLDGAVNNLTDMNIEPFDRDIEEDDWMFSDVITLHYEVFA